MVESGGLENRCTRKGTVGSNPTLSAKSIADLGLRIDGNDCGFGIADCGLIGISRLVTIRNPKSAFRNRERCRSGLTGSTGNAVYGKPYRGFESHPLRQYDFGF